MRPARNKSARRSGCSRRRSSHPAHAPGLAGLGLSSLAGTGFEFVATAEVRDKAIAVDDRLLSSLLSSCVSVSAATVLELKTVPKGF
jgi:hypothetical protein